MLKILEEDNYLFIDTLILFLLVNYSPQIMLIYIGMSFLGSIFYHMARNNGISMIPYESRKDNRINAIMIAVVALGIFSVLYNVIHSQFATISLPFADFLIKTFATTPALETSQIIQFFVFGVLIPIVETKFFFRTLLGWFSWKYNLSLASPTKFDAIKVIAAMSIVFMLFHITAKGIKNTPELIATLLFGVISCVMVIMFKEVKQAAYFHIFTNSFAMMSAYGGI